MNSLAYLFIFLSAAGCIRAAATVDRNPDLPFLSVDDYRFHIKTSGDPENPPLIVIHGGPGIDFHYLLPMEILSDEYYMLFYDQRGTGLSSRKSSLEFSTEQDIDDLYKIIQQFSPDRKVILLGHSYGAMIASGFMARFPELVDKAVIIEPGILTQETAREFVRTHREKNSRLGALKLIWPLLQSLFVVNEGGQERYDYIMTAMAGSGKGQPYQCPGVSLPPESFVRSGYQVFRKTIFPVMNEPDLFRSDLVTGLKKFQGSVLLLSSSCSFIGYDYQETLHRQYFPKQAVHVRIPDTGHNFPTTHPEKTVKIIRQFLKSGQVDDTGTKPDTAAFGRIRMTLDGILKKGETPGLQYAIFNKDGLVWNYEGGLADISSGKKVTKHTTFHGFSLTKTFTAVAVLQLADQGRLKLDDSAARYLKDYFLPDSVTIRHLLNHTSGLPNPIPLRWVHPQERSDSFDFISFRREVIRKNLKSDISPGRRMKYSNLDYLLLGEIIEKVSGQDFRSYVKANILEAADISDSELDFLISNPSLHAGGYLKKNSLLNFTLGFFISKKQFIKSEESGWLRFRNFYVNGPSYGGLIGTASGFGKFLSALLTEPSFLLTPESVQLMFQRTALSDGKTLPVSLGWFYGELNGNSYYAHAGGGGGYYSEIRIYPALKLGSVILCNRTGITDERILDRIDAGFTELSSSAFF